MNHGVIATGNQLLGIRCAEHHSADHASRMYTIIFDFAHDLRLCGSKCCAVVGGVMTPPYICVVLKYENAICKNVRILGANVRDIYKLLPIPFSVEI